MHTPHRIAPKIIVAALAAGLLALAVILLTPLPTPAEPMIKWQPKAVIENVTPGASKTVSVSFISSEDVANVGVRVVPELAPYVQTSPTSFANIAKGQTVNLDLTISAPVDSLPKNIDGVIQLRSGAGAPKTFAKPLPVKVEVVWRSLADAQLGLVIQYPPAWVIRPKGKTTIFSNVSEPSELKENALQTESFFEIRSLADKNPNRLPINQWFDQFFSEGFAVDPISKTLVLVEGRDAVRIETIEIGGVRVHLYIPNQADVIEITYGLYAPQFVDEYESILNSLRFTQ